jgi:hypothetical protein
MRFSSILCAIFYFSFLTATEPVTTMRAPANGIQPQAVIDAVGTMHLIYFTGDAKGGDAWYVRQVVGTTEFSTPLRVNSQPASVMAIGSVRGAHLAIGRQGRAHVAWMGAAGALPKAIGDSAPMLYSRLNAAGTAFEPQRNLVQAATGLDGGGTVAANERGDVEVAWHAMAGAKDEAGRAVYVAVSHDDGTTFAREVPVTTQPTGACGCCSMCAFTDALGHVAMLYRGASGNTERGMILLTSTDGKRYTVTPLQSWKLQSCPMSTSAINAAAGHLLIAWQTQDQVFWSALDEKSLMPSTSIAASGQGKARKHPAIAGNARGDVLMVWSEGTGWNQGGSVHWQRYDRTGKELGAVGRADGLPAWSLPTAAAQIDGSFVVLY